jgi:hypothetical protein
MMFTHPELYDSRDGLPLYTALYELKRRGLLHRGMDASELRKLIGAPAHQEHSEIESQDEDPHLTWTYDLHASTLQVQFSKDGKVSQFTQTTDGDNSKTWEW